MQTYRIRRIDPVPCANAFALCMGGLAAVFSVAFVLFVTSGSLFGFGPGSFEASPTLLFAPVFFPIVYAIMGWFFGSVGAAVYNIVVVFLGGVRIHLESEPIDEDQPPETI